MGLLNFIEHPIQGLGGLLGYGQQSTSLGPSFTPQGGVPTLQDMVTQTASTMNPVDPYAPTGGQRFSALLKDLGAEFQGRPANYQDGLVDQNIAEAQKRLQIQNAIRQQQALAAFAAKYGAGGPQAAPGSPMAGGMPQGGPGGPPMLGGAPGGPATPSRGLPSIRKMGPDLLALDAAGVKTGDMLNILDKSAPQIDVANGVAYDKRDPGNVGQRMGVNLANVNNRMVDTQNPDNANITVPQVGPGQIVLYDANHQPVAVQDLQGNITSIGQHAQAQSAGSAIGSAPYTFVDVPTLSGAPEKRSVSSAAGGVFTGQTPTQAALQSAGAQAQIGLPAAIANADQTLTLIEQMKKSPALRSRTGVLGAIPAIPGTEGANFDAMDAQLRGKLFMDAYAGLKGGGQITEVEGKRATDAIGRLNRTQTPQGYVAALNDLASVIQAGKERAERQAALGQRGAVNPGSIPTLADIDAAIARKQGKR